MKPLKPWQIVLLVIFYPVGVCVLIYRLLKKNRLKREAEAREAARIQTFPDDYVFHSAWTEAMRQIGNAVPMRLAEIVGQSIVNQAI